MWEAQAVAGLGAIYRDYNAACNAHAFERLDRFVAPGIEVNGAYVGIEAYQESLRDVIRAFPDYRWDLRHLLVDEPWVAAHFHDTGTHRGTFLGVEPTGRQVATQEFAFYRFDDGLIAEVWVTADDLATVEQLRAP